MRSHHLARPHPSIQRAVYAISVAEIAFFRATAVTRDALEGVVVPAAATGAELFADGGQAQV